VTAAKCRNFKACCESGGTEKRRHALPTTSRQGTTGIFLPAGLAQKTRLGTVATVYDRRRYRELLDCPRSAKRKRSLNK